MMKNWNKILIKAFAWLFLVMGITSTFATIYIDYLQQPWLVGANYIPADFTEPEMADVYVPLAICFMFILGGSVVILNHKKANEIFLSTLLIYLLISTSVEFSINDYRYVFSKRWMELTGNFVIAGIPIYLILREKNKKVSQGLIKTT